MNKQGNINRAVCPVCKIKKEFYWKILHNVNMLSWMVKRLFIIRRPLTNLDHSDFQSVSHKLCFWQLREAGLSTCLSMIQWSSNYNKTPPIWFYSYKFVHTTYIYRTLCKMFSHFSTFVGKIYVISIRPSFEPYSRLLGLSHNFSIDL